MVVKCSPGEGSKPKEEGPYFTSQQGVGTLNVVRQGDGGLRGGGSDIICPPPQESAPRLRNIPQLHEIVCDIVKFLENPKKFLSFLHFVIFPWSQLHS